jgi:hypothetical protein
MSVIVITTPGAENKHDANLILGNNLVLNIVLRTGCGVLTRVESAVTMAAKNLLASLRLLLSKNRHDYRNATARTDCTLYKSAKHCKELYLCLFNTAHFLYCVNITHSVTCCLYFPGNRGQRDSLDGSTHARGPTCKPAKVGSFNSCVKSAREVFVSPRYRASRADRSFPRF